MLVVKTWIMIMSFAFYRSFELQQPSFDQINFTDCPRGWVAYVRKPKKTQNTKFLDHQAWVFWYHQLCRLFESCQFLCLKGQPVNFRRTMSTWPSCHCLANYPIFRSLISSIFIDGNSLNLFVIERNADVLVTWAIGFIFYWIPSC